MLYSFHSIRLNEEAENVPIRLGLFDELGSQMIGTVEGAKISNLFRVQRNGLAANLLQLFRPQDDLGGVDGWRKDAKLGLLATHEQLRGRRGRRSCC